MYHKGIDLLLNYPSWRFKSSRCHILHPHNSPVAPLNCGHPRQPLIDVLQLGQAWFLLCSPPIRQPGMYFCNQVLNRDTQYCLALL